MNALFSRITLWRTVAVLVGTAISVYVLELLGNEPIIGMSSTAALLCLVFIGGQAAMIWGMFSNSPPESNRLVNAAPTLLGVILAGFYIVWIAGAAHYFIVPVALIGLATASVFLRRACAAIAFRLTN